MPTAQAVYLPDAHSAVSKLLDNAEIEIGDTDLEQRHRRTSVCRRSWTVGFNVGDADVITAVKKMYRLFGRHTSFLFSPPEPEDYTYVDQPIGTGDGTTAIFPLKITDTLGTISGFKYAKHPLSGTVKIYVNGTEKTITTQWTVNLTTGDITFTGGNIPTAGQLITADFEADVAVRFDSTDMQTTVMLATDDNLLHEVRQISIIECLSE